MIWQHKLKSLMKWQMINILICILYNKGVVNVEKVF